MNVAKGKPPRHITVKIFGPPELKLRPQKVLFKAPRDQWLTPAIIDNVLADAARRIEAQRPTEEYRMVAVGRYQYNFIYAGKCTTARDPVYEDVIPEIIERSKLPSFAPTMLTPMTDVTA